jgi:predicted RNA-binding protein YlqC (UPF0109 family)
MTEFDADERVDIGNVIGTVVRAIVDEPDAVNIKVMESEKTTVVEVRSAQADIGKIVGKQGAMAHALRTICTSASGRDDHRYLVNILE